MLAAADDILMKWDPPPYFFFCKFLPGLELQKNEGLCLFYENYMEMNRKLLYLPGLLGIGLD